MVLFVEEAGDAIAEFVAGDVVDGYAEDGEFFRQESGFFEVVERRDELARGEIAGGSEDDHGAGSGAALCLLGFFGGLFEMGEHRGG